MSFLMRHESMSFSRAKRSVDKFSRKNQDTTKKLDPSNWVITGYHFVTLNPPSCCISVTVCSAEYPKKTGPLNTIVVGEGVVDLVIFGETVGSPETWSLDAVLVSFSFRS